MFKMYTGEMLASVCNKRKCYYVRKAPDLVKFSRYTVCSHAL